MVDKPEPPTPRPPSGLSRLARFSSKLKDRSGLTPRQFLAVVSVAFLAIPGAWLRDAAPQVRIPVVLAAVVVLGGGAGYIAAQYRVLIWEENLVYGFIAVCASAVPAAYKMLGRRSFDVWGEVAIASLCVGLVASARMVGDTADTQIVEEENEADDKATSVAQFAQKWLPPENRRTIADQVAASAGRGWAILMSSTAAALAFSFAGMGFIASSDEPAVKVPGMLFGGLISAMITRSAGRTDALNRSREAVVEGLLRVDEPSRIRGAGTLIVGRHDAIAARSANFAVRYVRVVGGMATYSWLCWLAYTLGAAPPAPEALASDVVVVTCPEGKALAKVKDLDSEKGLVFDVGCHQTGVLPRPGTER